MTDKMQKHTRSEIIKALSQRDGYFCFYCKKIFNNDLPITIDHFYPKAHGGTWELSNLRLSCFKCNNTKGDKIPSENGFIHTVKSVKMPKIKRPEVCDHCMSGRLLLIDEICEMCGSEPQPKQFPHARKKKPKNCPHEGVFWCWQCMCGLIKRTDYRYEL